MAEWRWLWRYARTVIGGMAVATVTFLGVELTYMGIIFAQQMIIDDVFLAGQFDRLGSVLLFFAFMCGLHICGHAIGAYTYVGPYRNLTRKLTGEVMRVIHRMPVHHIRQERTAAYVHLLSDDVPRIGEFMAMRIPQLIGGILLAMVLIVTLAKTHMGMLGLVVVLSMTYALLVRWFQPRLQRMGKEVQDRKSDLLVTVEEGISSTRDVLAYHRMDWEQRRYDGKFASYFAAVMKQGKLVNLQLIVSDPIRRVAQLLVLGIGGWLALQGELSPGMFVLVYAFSNELMTTFHELYQQLMKVSEHLGYVERVRRQLESETVDDGEVQLHAGISHIQIDNVTFTYPGESTVVLKDLSVQISSGSKIAFVGMSGGGKSSIVQLLARFYEPTSGLIRVNGIPLPHISREHWSKHVSFVFQEPYLFPDTIRANLLLGREECSEETMREVCRMMHIDDVFESLPDGYDTIIGERGITLSGGQRQRLALARAVLSDPEVLILDEATSALDLETERLVQANLDGLRKDKLTIIVAHRLSTVQNADTIYVMAGGMVTEQGTHEELLLQGIEYRKLVYAESDQYEPSAVRLVLAD